MIVNEEALKQIEKDKNFKGYKLKGLNNFNKKDEGDFLLYFSLIED